MEKDITFSVGGLRFIDSLNFLQGSLDSLVRATPKEALKITSTIAKGSELLYKKGIYPYEYIDSWERFSETSLPDKQKFYSKLNDENITDEEYAHAQTAWEVFTPPSGRGLVIPIFFPCCVFFGGHLPQTSGFCSAKEILVVSFATQPRAF